MADRLLVAYKSPLQRTLEIALVIAFAVGISALWRHEIRGISPSYAVIAALGAGLVVVPRLGDQWAARRGAPLLDTDERDRRYLAEYGPIGIAGRSVPLYAVLPRVSQLRQISGRAPGRSRRRA
jgi:hypothetical protein